MMELTYTRIYSPPHRFDVKVGPMLVGRLRILRHYGSPVHSIAQFAPEVSWALDRHFNPAEVAFITKAIHDEAAIRNVTMRMTA